jgi:hypothetical protein
MEFTSTVIRLMSLIEVRKEHEDLSEVAHKIDRLLAKQIDRVKVNVMTHTFDALDYFNTNEWTPETARQQKGGTYGT